MELRGPDNGCSFMGKILTNILRETLENKIAGSILQICFHDATPYKASARRGGV
jgi:hypothetical protein